MKRTTAILLALAALATAAALPKATAGTAFAGKSPIAASPTSPTSALLFPDPEDWSIDFETSVLWRITGETPLNYTLLTEAISIRTPYHIHIPFRAGALFVRGNFTLLSEAFLEGPESYYFGLSGSPSIEYWLPGHRTHFYFSSGGGFGWLDSQGVAGGQGQDFTLNWFIKAGVRHAFTESLSVSAGIFFQHLSNGGATDPNPGLDGLGPSIGLSWKL